MNAKYLFVIILVALIAPTFTRDDPSKWSLLGKTPEV